MTVSALARKGPAITPMQLPDALQLRDLGASLPQGGATGPYQQPVPSESVKIDAELAGSDPRQALQQLTRGQFHELENRTVPLEQQIREQVSPEAREREANRAGDLADRSSLRQEQIDARDLARRGQTLSSRDASGLDRRRDLSRGLGSATAENVTRRSLRQRNSTVLDDLGSRRAGVTGQAIDELSDLAGLQVAREENNKASKAGLLGGAGAIVGGVLGGWVGGPQGATIGSSVGQSAGQNLSYRRQG